MAPVRLEGHSVWLTPHFPKEQLASSGEFHPVRLDALSQSRVEVLFHATKVRERFLSASAEPAEGCGRQIFGGREHDLAA